MQTQTLSGGFDAPATQAAHAFRAVMNAMARPGTIHDIAGAAPPAPLSPAAGAVLLTLCDADTPLFLAGTAECAPVRDWLAFHTGAPLAGPAHCMFALGTWDALLPLDPYPLGSAQYPDRSATLIIELPELKASGATLSGPGIAESVTLSLPDRAAFLANAAHFPRGLDFILTSGSHVAALPRTTQVR